MAGSVAELEADLDPFGGRGGGHVGRRSVGVLRGGRTGAGVLPRTLGRVRRVRRVGVGCRTAIIIGRVGWGRGCI